MADESVPQEDSTARFSKWAHAIIAAVIATATAAGSVYSMALKYGVGPGSVEKSNMILANQHIGEDPVSTTTVVTSDDDYQVVKNYSNGDSIYHRRVKTPAGNLLRINRWTSKRSIEEIIGSTELAMPRLSLLSVAYAAEIVQGRGADDVVDERYVGARDDGISVYEITWSDGVIECVFIDEATGASTGISVPPCAQYIKK